MIAGLGTLRERSGMSAPMRGTRRLMSSALLALGLLMPPVQATAEGELTFKRIPTQFIAALGDPGATFGNGAQSWGLWRRDPGPRERSGGPLRPLRTESRAGPRAKRSIDARRSTRARRIVRRRRSGSPCPVRPGLLVCGHACQASPSRMDPKAPPRVCQARELGAPPGSAPTTSRWRCRRGPSC